MNNAAYQGDLHLLQGLIRAGADPKKTDYDGRSPLVSNMTNNVNLITSNSILYCNSKMNMAVN